MPSYVGLSVPELPRVCGLSPRKFGGRRGAQGDPWHSLGGSSLPATTHLLDGGGWTARQVHPFFLRRVRRWHTRPPPAHRLLSNPVTRDISSCCFTARLHVFSFFSLQNNPRCRFYYCPSYGQGHRGGNFVHMLKPQFPVPWNVVVFGDSCIWRWFSLNGQLGPYFHLWCPYKKRTFGHRERPWGCTEEGPCEETAGGGGWPSANQGQGLQKKPTWQGARCNLTLTFQPPEPWKNRCVYFKQFSLWHPKQKNRLRKQTPCLYGHSHHAVSPKLKNLCRVSQPSSFILWLHICLSEARYVVVTHFCILN